MKNKPIVIGVGGFARCGKDTFVKVARKILTENGYTSEKLAFADALKHEIGPFIKEYYGIDVWTDNTDEKTLIRPLLVAHGCQKRIQTNGTYWVDKVDVEIERMEAVRDLSKHVVFISDCRFPNEVTWVRQRWGGWFIHLKKYVSEPKKIWLMDLPTQQIITKTTEGLDKIFDKAPNDEEAKNDPICEQNSNFRLEIENIISRTERLTGNKITVDNVPDDTYLNEEIKLCLSNCPFLTIK